MDSQDAMSSTHHRYASFQEPRGKYLQTHSIDVRNLEILSETLFYFLLWFIDQPSSISVSLGPHLCTKYLNGSKANWHK